MTHAHPVSDLAKLSVGSLVWMASAQPVLDESSEDNLIQRARVGDRDALEQLAVRNLRIVIDEAIRARGRGLSQQRLVRVGLGALLDAVRFYEPLVHGRFSSHLRDRVRLALQDTISVS
jgi:DNA-directed RNA polymerase sigma subunit (sigma70/sigma32)